MKCVVYKYLLQTFMMTYRKVKFDSVHHLQKDGLTFTSQRIQLRYLNLLFNGLILQEQEIYKLKRLFKVYLTNK